MLIHPHLLTYSLEKKRLPRIGDSDNEKMVFVRLGVALQEGKSVLEGIYEYQSKFWRIYFVSFLFHLLNLLFPLD